MEGNICTTKHDVQKLEGRKQKHDLTTHRLKRKNKPYRQNLKKNLST